MKRIEPLRHYLVSEALCTWGFLLRGGLVTDLALPWGASCTSDPTKTRPSLPIRGEGSWRFRVQSSSNGESSGKQVRSTFTRARKHRGHTVRAGSEPFEGIPLTLGEDTTPEVIAHGVEFVALPGKAEKLQAVIPEATRKALGNSHGFSDCLVLVSEQEARLVTVITLLDANGSHKTLQRKFTTSQETVGALRGSLVANAKTRSISCHAVVTPFQKRLSGIARY